MADTIQKVNKLVFTTKQKYDELKQAGQLEEGVIYAIDASQAATTTEVKSTLEEKFNNFGADLGMDLEVAKIYNIPTTLVELVGNGIIERYKLPFDQISIDENQKYPYHQADHTIRLELPYNQNITDGMFITTIEQDGVEPIYTKVNQSSIPIPEKIDTEKPSVVKVTDIFNTAHLTYNVLPYGDYVNYFIKAHKDGRVQYTTDASDGFSSQSAKYFIRSGGTDIVVLDNNHQPLDTAVDFSYDIVVVLDKEMTKYLDYYTNTWHDIADEVTLETLKELHKSNLELIDPETYFSELNKSNLDALRDTLSTVDVTDISKVSTVNVGALEDKSIADIRDVSTGFYDTIKSTFSNVKVLLTNNSDFDYKLVDLIDKFPNLKAVIINGNGKQYPGYPRVDSDFIRSHSTIPFSIISRETDNYVYYAGWSKVDNGEKWMALPSDIDISKLKEAINA